MHPHRCEACGRPVRHTESLCPSCRRDLERHLRAAASRDPDDRLVDPAAEEDGDARPARLDDEVAITS
jgi:hypothetical protein